MTFGNKSWGCDDATSQALLDAYIDASAVGGAAVLDLTDAAVEGLVDIGRLKRAPASQRMVRVK